MVAEGDRAGIEGLSGGRTWRAQMSAFWSAIRQSKDATAVPIMLTQVESPHLTIVHSLQRACARSGLSDASSRYTAVESAR